VLNRIDVDGRMRELSNVGISLPEPGGSVARAWKVVAFCERVFSAPGSLGRDGPRRVTNGRVNLPLPQYDGGQWRNMVGATQTRASSKGKLANGDAYHIYHDRMAADSRSVGGEKKINL
jgi:hypothetical protein